MTDDFLDAAEGQERTWLDFRRRLHRMLWEAEEHRRRLREWGAGGSLQETAAELSTYDQHTADLGTETYERSRDLGLLEEAGRQIEDIRDALERLEQGRFGVCERCGMDIPLERLQALPTARLCARCARERERSEPTLDDRPLRSSSAAGTREGRRSPFLERLAHGAWAIDDRGREDVWDDLSRYPNANSSQDDPEPAADEEPGD